MLSREFAETLYNDSVRQAVNADNLRSDAGFVRLYQEPGLEVRGLVSAVTINTGQEPVHLTYSGWRGLTFTDQNGIQQPPPAALQERWEVMQQLPPELWAAAIAAGEIITGTVKHFRDAAWAASSPDGQIITFGDAAVPGIVSPNRLNTRRCQTTPGNLALRTSLLSTIENTPTTIVVTPRSLEEAGELLPRTVHHLLDLAKAGKAGTSPTEVRILLNNVPEPLKDSVSSACYYDPNLGPSASLLNGTGDDAGYRTVGRRFADEAYFGPSQQPDILDALKQTELEALNTDQSIGFLLASLEDY